MPRFTTTRSFALGALYVLVALAPAGCKSTQAGAADGAVKEGAGSASASASTSNGSMASTTDSAARDATDKMLALSAPTGTTALDTEVFKLQTIAKSSPERPEAWVLLGRAWVREARDSGDPGFYLNADAAAKVALAIAPGDASALDLRTLVLLNDHRFEDARALAARVVAAHPEDPMGVRKLERRAARARPFRRGGTSRPEDDGPEAEPRFV